MGYEAGALRLATAGVILAAGASLSACGGAAKAAGTPTASAPASSESPVGGYEGWWNATPATGSSAGLPQETVAVNTRTNRVVDAFSRKINDAGRPTKITDVPYTVVHDPSWPADSVVIIDVVTNKMIENFRVDLYGNPLR
ncbi:hypothetical protein [Pseudarthrobacter sp. PvP090]|uniref:hypothetical protein n=1 Tax=Pseudarthrobacter sp. PvP090 TaxID=3156393 RepID=UPI003398EAA7